MAATNVVEPEDWIEPGDFYCPECGGEVGALSDGSYKCIAAVEMFIGCGWRGKNENDEPPVKAGGEP